MRSFLVAFAGLAVFAATGSAQAKIAITIDKNEQLMTVAVDGVERYRWPVSTGNPSHETPNGSFRTFRMEEDHFSKEFDDAPMPHSIFFTKIGHAIHGTDSEGHLGSPVSHGCVRLSRANATILYALVEKDGVLNTTVTLTGSSQIALARHPRTRANTAVAAREPGAQYAPQYGGPGDPIVLTPRQPPAGQYAQQRADDGYIYPAD
ncbi:MAG: L,D-transpeptidase, partial [Bradyrhizobium sp.]